MDVIAPLYHSLTNCFEHGAADGRFVALAEDAPTTRINAPIATPRTRRTTQVSLHSAPRKRNLGPMNTALRER